MAARARAPLVLEENNEAVSEVPAAGVTVHGRCRCIGIRLVKLLVGSFFVLCGQGLARSKGAGAVLILMAFFTPALVIFGSLVQPRPPAPELENLRRGVAARLEDHELLQTPGAAVLHDLLTTNLTTKLLGAFGQIAWALCHTGLLAYVLVNGCSFQAEEGVSHGNVKMIVTYIELSCCLSLSTQAFITWFCLDSPTVYSSARTLVNSVRSLSMLKLLQVFNPAGQLWTTFSKMKSLFGWRGVLALIWFLLIGGTLSLSALWVKVVSVQFVVAKSPMLWTPIEWSQWMLFANAIVGITPNLNEIVMGSLFMHIDPDFARNARDLWLDRVGKAIAEESGRRSLGFCITMTLTSKEVAEILLNGAGIPRV